MSYEEMTKRAMYEDPNRAQSVGSYGGLGDEPIRKDLSIADELKKLEGIINEMESASQEFVNRVAPVLFFGGEKEKVGPGNDRDTPPGSEMARQLFIMRERLMGTAAFLRIMSQKVNL